MRCCVTFLFFTWRQDTPLTVALSIGMLAQTSGRSNTKAYPESLSQQAHGHAWIYAIHMFHKPCQCIDVLDNGLQRLQSAGYVKMSPPTEFPVPGATPYG